MLPAGIYEWEQVANLYKERSCESDVRDKDDIKRHWVEKLCNKFHKCLMFMVLPIKNRNMPSSA